MIEEILTGIAKLSPLFAGLVIAIYYLYKEKIALKNELNEERNKCHSEISSLNKEMRENERQNINIISKLSDVIDKMSEKIDDNHQDIKDQLRDVKDLIKEKINELKNNQ